MESGGNHEKTVTDEARYGVKLTPDNQLDRGNVVDQGIVNPAHANLKATNMINSKKEVKRRTKSGGGLENDLGLNTELDMNSNCEENMNIK